jgi:hypothetical protein
MDSPLLLGGIYFARRMALATKGVGDMKLLTIIQFVQFNFIETVGTTTSSPNQAS